MWIQFLPLGFGIAFGIFGKGYFIHWTVEAAIISMFWGIGSYVFKSQTYQDYLKNCEKLGEKPSIYQTVTFIFLQTFTAAIAIFIPALIGTFIKKIMS